MTDARECPNCGSYDTERVYSDDVDGEAIENVRICNDCPAEWTNHFAFSHKDITRVEGMALCRNNHVIDPDDLDVQGMDSVCPVCGLVIPEEDIYT